VRVADPFLEHEPTPARNLCPDHAPAAANAPYPSVPWEASRSLSAGGEWKEDHNGGSRNFTSSSESDADNDECGSADEDGIADADLSYPDSGERGRECVSQEELEFWSSAPFVISAYAV
jgi:hypothetical protein